MKQTFTLEQLQAEYARCAAAFRQAPDVRLGAALKQIEKAIRAAKRKA